MKKPGETSIQSFSLPLTSLVTDDNRTELNHETIEKVRLHGDGRWHRVCMCVKLQAVLCLFDLTSLTRLTAVTTKTMSSRSGSPFSQQCPSTCPCRLPYEKLPVLEFLCPYNLYECYPSVFSSAFLFLGICVCSHIIAYTAICLCPLFVYHCVLGIFIHIRFTAIISEQTNHVNHQQSHCRNQLLNLILVIHADLITTRSELWKVLFLAPSVCGFFVCVWNISRTTEQACVKFTWKTCLVPHSDAFEGQGSKQPAYGLCLVKLVSL